MLVIAVSIVIGLLIAYRFADDMYGEISDWVMGLMLGGLVGIVVLFAGTMVLGSSLPKTTKFANSDLVALQDGSGTEGSFFLGTGYVDSTMKYTYYRTDGEAKKLETVDAKDIRVFEDTDKPYVREIVGCDGQWQWVAVCVEDYRVVEIHVPKSTIKDNFTLDAK